MGDVDRHLFSEGQHWKIYENFGAHLRTIGDATGVYFAVWAPNAQRVSVVGDFNGWDGRSHPMRKRIEAGIWEIFIPGVTEGAHYKYEIRDSSGQVVLKSDPFSFFGQHGSANRFFGFQSRSFYLEGRRLDGSAQKRPTGLSNLSASTRFISVRGPEFRRRTTAT